MDTFLWITFGLLAVINIVLADLIMALINWIVGDRYFPNTIRKICSPTVGDIILFLILVGSGTFGALCTAAMLIMVCVAFVVVVLIRYVEWLCKFSERTGPLWTICRPKK